MTPRAFFVTAAASLASLSFGACGASEPDEDAGGPPVPPVCGLPSDARVRRLAPLARPSQCGSTLDFTPINQYAGGFASAQLREDAVALLTVNCTGTLIDAAAGPVVLTAGHCGNLGDALQVAFNVEDAPDGDPLFTSGTVIERADEPDYALIALDQLPVVTPTPLTTRSSARLAVIQHPRGMPKVIAEGDFLAACEPLFIYGDLDTLEGSSGAGVLTSTGYLFGIHTDGNCDEHGGGANVGWTAAAIVDASAYLQPADLADR